MLISVVNHTNGRLTDKKVQDGIRAVNRQIAEDFAPHWHISAQLRLEGTMDHTVDSETMPELRGDAIIYLWDKASHADDALGVHKRSPLRGIPFGFVFYDLVEELEEEWTVTFSHEALELIGDPEMNRLVAGPHPKYPEQRVFYWYEMCDAVQDEKYVVDGHQVSNFVLPLYFTRDAEKGGRNDFLGKPHKGTTLQSFGINPGGYVGFYNPVSGKHETFGLDDDDGRAAARLHIKSKATLTRRSTRYEMGMSYQQIVDAKLRIPDDRRRDAAGPAPRKPRREVKMLRSDNDRPGHEG
jgi:hypothetical protein